jgi:hypothetical protein
MQYSRHENGNLKKNALNKIESLCHADSKRFLKIKNRPSTFKEKHILSWRFFEFTTVLSGGGVALLTIFESPANGGGGRRLVIEALSSSGSGHIGLSPFFSLSAWLTVADKPRAGG